jgi:hypothetical protein
MSDFVQIISTVGFPIFSFLLAGWGLKYVYDKERKSLDETISRLDDLTKAVNHNSETLARLVDERNERSEET